jgi:GNAT superfamily N-acetyltransferase
MVTVRSAEPSDLVLLASSSTGRPACGGAVEGTSFRLPSARSGPQVRAWGLVAEDAGVSVGHLFYSTMFSTWDARDFFDVHLFQLAETPARRWVAEALLAGLREHAAERGIRTIRWLDTSHAEDAVSAMPAALHRLDKVRFTLCADTAHR